MITPPRVSSLYVDLALATAALVGLGLVLPLAFARLSPPVVVSEAPVIAHADEVQGRVRFRPAQTLVWGELFERHPLHARDHVYVGEASAATLRFDDGSELSLSESSLITLELPPSGEAPTRVNVYRGAVVATAGKGSLEVDAGGLRARLAAGAEGFVRVTSDRRARVEMRRGEAEAEAGEDRATLQPGEGRDVSAEGRLSEGSRLGIELLSPKRGARVPAGAWPVPLAFRWQTGEGADVLEVAADPSFSETRPSELGEGGEAIVELTGPGTYFWRVRRASEGREVASEIRLLVVEEAVPPEPLRPRPGEIVYTPRGEPVVFAWAPPRGMQRFEVRLARDEAMEQVVFDEAVVGQSTRRRGLEEGVYYWQVRPEGAVGPELTSEARPFRLITRPLPRPPKVFDPTLERGVPSE